MSEGEATPEGRGGVKRVCVSPCVGITAAAATPHPLGASGPEVVNPVNSRGGSPGLAAAARRARRPFNAHDGA